ncbi:Helitron helicase [Phytophthora megakarya]|uniref:ATP-dependent DNA helicase n=1 Tax=Phytophthora megakarya TaxID=4795 RepID=A0A225V138_9STRA|nr:Helitron helicase [Phytophthora megakarya]
MFRHKILIASFFGFYFLLCHRRSPKSYKYLWSVVDRVIREMMKNESEPSGGKVIVFSGDHRQILPVLNDATRAETIAACFKSSDL